MFSRTPNFALVASAAMIAAMTLSSPASAVPWTNFISNGVNTLSDDSAELFIDKVGAVPGQVDVGDVYLGGLVFNSIANLTFGTVNFGVGGVDEATAVFGLQVIAVAPGSFTFAPVLNLQAEFLVATGVDIGSVGNNTFAVFFNDTTPDAVRSGNTFNNFITQASNGTQNFELTFNPGDIIAATIPVVGNTTGLAAFCDTAAPNAGVGGFFGSSTVSSTTTSVQVGTQVGVSSNLSCPVDPEDYTLRDDATFAFDAQIPDIPRIPEPATLALLGLGLAGLGFSRRRKLN